MSRTAVSKAVENQTDAVMSKGKNKSVFKIMTVTILLIGFAALVSAFIAVKIIKSSYMKPGPLSEGVIFTVPAGAGLSRLSSDFEKNGIISSATYLKLNARLSGVGANIKAGEYKIPAGASMSDIIEIISSGQTVLYPITAPEGLTTAQILRILESSEHLKGQINLTPAEGALLPETYMTPRGMTRDALIRQMMQAQTELVDKLWDSRQDNLPIKTKREAIILASVVEKETGVTSERHEVAGVFTNRLRKGMRLQSDPTIIYGISKGEPLMNRAGKRRGIFRSEIDRKTPWNTYQIDGLPQTAICNPGKDSIAAVLQPATTKNLYFVADGSGGHAFASTLSGHNANVAKWRKIERQRRQR